MIAKGRNCDVVRLGNIRIACAHDTLLCHSSAGVIGQMQATLD
jgi:hypothetical protein